MSQSTEEQRTAHPACPEWCTKPPSHDPFDLADGGRVHYASVGSDLLTAGFSDSDQDGWFATIWAEERGEALEISADSASALAAALRGRVADLLATIQWLEGQR